MPMQIQMQKEIYIRFRSISRSRSTYTKYKIKLYFKCHIIHVMVNGAGTDMNAFLDKDEISDTNVFTI